MKHGYNRYAYGCRCDVCRAAKAAYMRDKRAQAAEIRRAALADGAARYEATGTEHGRSGYQNHGCRCPVCFRAAKAAGIRRQRESAS